MPGHQRSRQGSWGDGERSGMWSHMARDHRQSTTPLRVRGKTAQYSLLAGLDGVLGDLVEMGFDTGTWVLGRRRRAPRIERPDLDCGPQSEPKDGGTAGAATLIKRCAGTRIRTSACGRPGSGRRCGSEERQMEQPGEPKLSAEVLMLARRRRFAETTTKGASAEEWDGLATQAEWSTEPPVG